MDQEGDFDIQFSVNDQKQKQINNPYVSGGQSITQPKDNVPAQKNDQEKFGFQSQDFSLKNAAHPQACVSTFGFKAAAVLFYFVGGFFLNSILVFILVAILSAADFWTVKNVTGRLLVGLRWWTELDSKGNEKWKFESPNKEFSANKVDQTIFWGSQLISSAFWAVWLVIQVFSVDIFWGMLVALNFFLCGINLYGFYKCKGDHSKKIKEFKGEGLRQLAGKMF